MIAAADCGATLWQVRAVALEAFGGPERLKVVEVAEPVPVEGQVRIAVHVAGTECHRRYGIRTCTASPVSPADS